MNTAVAREVIAEGLIPFGSDDASVFVEREIDPQGHPVYHATIDAPRSVDVEFLDSSLQEGDLEEIVRWAVDTGADGVFDIRQEIRLVLEHPCACCDPLYKLIGQDVEEIINIFIGSGV